MMSTTEDRSAPPGAEAPPRLAEGLELIGEYEGSGFKEAPSIAKRADGQVIQLPQILYLVAEAADGHRSYQQIADYVSQRSGRGLDAGDARMLVEEKLRPLGVLATATGDSPRFDKPDPLLALRFRAAVLPSNAAQALGRLFRPLFVPPVELAVLAGVVVLDVWLFGSHGLAQGVRQSLNQPAVILLLFGVIVLSAAFHEFGHAAGCTAGGARPGDMGAGIYLAWPAFYTDVTDAYRLGKRGRLRTDLAGVYFNCIFMLGSAAVYFATGFEPLLMIILVQHIEIVHQLLPLLRLDGYYIMADLTGVPDLYHRIGAILASSVPGTKPDERVTALKPWVRVVVTTWVLLVIPALLFQLLLILLHLPRIVATAWASGERLLHHTSVAIAHANVVTTASDLVQLVILVLPLVGVFYSLTRIGLRTTRSAWARTDGKPALRLGFVVLASAFVGLLLYSWVPAGNYKTIEKGERGTLGEGIASVRRLPSGRAPLVPLQRAEARGRLQPGEKVPTTPSPTTSTTLSDATDGSGRTTSTSMHRSTTTLRQTPTTAGSPTTTTP
jgi:putative peptide zinc metalloprotease protein